MRLSPFLVASHDPASSVAGRGADSGCCPRPSPRIRAYIIGMTMKRVELPKHIVSVGKISNGSGT